MFDGYITLFGVRKSVAFYCHQVSVLKPDLHLVKMHYDFKVIYDIKHYDSGRCLFEAYSINILVHV